ncbi:glycosyltransferase [Clostridium pasteurianum]|uniref:glycosyltransferase n=1 Tax=Clostridium pasteurianum TaxID=1501 RepID=UPI002260B568|nr:glycosyltransferase [Clostridium pasteurianum]UZW14974.1 glycosyltransferase [Clostridium pasteurianum]
MNYLKGLFVSLYNVEDDNAKGIKRKIEAQIKYLGRNCDGVDWVYKGNDGYIKLNGNKLYYGKNTKQLWFNATCDFYSLIKYIDLKKYEFIYIRYLWANLGLLKFAKHAKSFNKKVLVEIPTYPYEHEMGNNIKGNICRKLDRIVTSKLHKYVFRIVCTNKDETIFNIKTIRIDNGVDLEEVKIISNDKVKRENINAIAVASICRWHGYDRFINSMYQYRQKNKDLNLKFYLVGDGRKNDIQELKYIVKQKSMEDYVIFTGPKGGEELDSFYNNMDIAVSSLALFRAGGGHNPIKTKEYIAKGLPVITGYEDSIVPSSLEYIYKVEEDESIFDLKDILKWYYEGNFKHSDIRSFAEKHVSWDKQMKKVMRKVIS